MTSLLEGIIHPEVKHELLMRDISGWNGVPNIPSLDASIIASKATEGTGYVSPVFQQDWINTKAAGKGRMAYHFFHPSISALAQARFFLDTVKNAKLEDGDCLMLDHESTDGLDAGSVASAAIAFRHAVEEETNCKLVIYTYINFAETGNCEGLGNSPLFIADPSSPPGHPRVPLPWHEWTMHQYGQRKGIDEDICHFTNIEDFYKLAVLPKPPPLTQDQRMVKLSDGKQSKETLISLNNFKTGFKMTCGDATFEVTEDGCPMAVI
jgi:lysozyme